MADETTKPEDQPAEGEAPTEKPLSLWTKLWPFASLLIGATVMATGISLWLGPIRRAHRQQVLDDYQQGVDLLEKGQPLKSAEVLQSILPRLWRVEIPESEVYLLIGVANNRMAAQADRREGKQYRDRALAYLREGKKKKPTPARQLDLEEELGTSLTRAGEYDEARPPLRIALKIRQELASIILRRMVQATVEQNPIDFARVEVLSQAWTKVPELSQEDSEVAGQALALSRRKNGDELLQIMRKSGEEAILRDRLPAVEYVELSADAKLAVEGPDATLEFLQQKRAENARSLSYLLSQLIEGEMKRSPPDPLAAASLGWQRLDIEGISTEERDAALRRQAEILLLLGRPALARAQMRRMSDTGMPRGLRSYFFGKAFYDQANMMSSMSTERWLSSSVTLKQHGDQLNRAAEEARVQNSKMPGWVKSVARALDPTVIKAQLTELNFLQAIDHFKDAIADRELNDEAILGPCLLALGDSQQRTKKSPSAVETFERVMDGFPGSPLALAAEFLRAHVLFTQNDPTTVSAFEQATSKVESGEFKNPYLTLDRLRGLFEEGYRGYRAKEDYERATKLAQLYAKYSDRSVAETWLAESLDLWAEQLKTRGDKEPYLAMQNTYAQARELHRQASDAYYKAAQSDRAANNFTELLWQATTNAYAGLDFDNCLSRGEEFLSAHAEGPRDFAGKMLLARASMAKTDLENARNRLERALDRHPRQPGRFQARVLLARVYADQAKQIDPGTEDADRTRTELNDLAEQMLLKNTDGFDLEPVSSDWRESIIELGKLLYERGRYDEAIVRLSEGIRRFPQAAEVNETLSLIADSWFDSAKKPGELYEKEQTPRAKEFHRRERIRRLESALAEYVNVSQRLAAKQDSAPDYFTPSEFILMRNAYLRLGEVNRELGNYNQAIEAYTTAASRFQNRPDSLAAYVQMAGIYWQTGRGDDAVSTLRQARWVLGQLDEAVFEAQSSLSRRDWEQKLDELIGGP